MPVNSRSDALRRIARNVRFARGELSQQKFATQLRVSQPSVSRWENAEDTPDEASIAKMSMILGCTPADFRYKDLQAVNLVDPTQAPIIGTIGAGETVQHISAQENDAQAQLVDVPEGISGIGLKALRVVGDHNLPLRDGWLVFYRDVEGVADACLSELCVVQIHDGPLVLKEVRPGYKADTYNLMSWSGRAIPLENQRIAWAAPVLDIRPARK
jgi:transcriptional regulator with XRE-family HTH domain